MNKDQIAKELQVIPGVGKSIARDFINLGIYKVSDLRNKNPEKLYQQLNAYHGREMDRCMLYVFRCAVYFASHAQYNPDKLLWWNWKDR